MNQTEKTLEFDKIKTIWAQLALTDYAKEKIRSITPYLAEKELLVSLRETTQAKELIENWGNPPLASLKNIQGLMAAAEKGDCLSPSQLEEAESALVAVKRLRQYLTRCRQQNLSLVYYDENLDCLEEVREAINLQIRSGRVEDGASKLLKSLREETGRKEGQMREKADSAIRAGKEWMSDSFSTYRNGRLCIPVKKEYKFKINGSVIDQSATGSTVFMEPAAVAKLREELELLRIDEENEERRILYALTAMVADHSQVMEQNIKMMEKLDFIFSKGKLSLEYGGTEPRINTGRRLVIKDGRHPLIDKTICVPLSLEMGEAIRGVIITGPNTGGKTVAIKTVALNAMMAQCGLHVACDEADICMSSEYLCDIGDGQNLSENLSTFSAHISNVLRILKQAGRESLVIMDELGSGTDPAEGMGIAIAILEELKKSGALFLVTTHYPEVKIYAQKEDAMINARMTFDRESLKPLYELVCGEAGESCALYIAKKLGMPQAMLLTAVKAAYGDQIPEDMGLFGGDGPGAGDFEEDRRDGRDSGRREPSMKKETRGRIQRQKQGVRRQEAAGSFNRGDSVMVYPDKKIGIVCEAANERGVLRIQMPGKKIWVNHKRIKLLVKAQEMYPEDYDFSIIFDTVENRKLRHQMERKLVEGRGIGEE